MKKLILMFLLSFMFLIIKAQPPKGKGMGMGDMSSDAGVIIGLVYDKGLNTPVEYANLAIYLQTDSSLVTGALTDATGKFFLKEVPFGKYYLTANFIGYEKQIVSNIEINKDSRFKMLDTIYLFQASQELKEIEIYGAKDYMKYEIDKKVLDVAKNPNGTSGSAADVLEGTPSVQVDVDGNVSLRGSTNFTVLIDGKPSVLDANDVLQQTPASMIESIEIITNPSAKYDPEGTSGIINLVLKEKAITGFSGIVNTSVGWNNKYSTDFLFSYRIKKFNFFVGGNYNDMPRIGAGTADRITYNDTISYMTADGTRLHNHGGYGVKAGVDYYINDNNSISMTSNVGKFLFEMNANTNYMYWTQPETFTTYFLSNSLKTVDMKHYSGDLSYQHKFAKKDHQLDVYAFYSNRSGIDAESLKDIYTDANWNDLGISNVQHKSGSTNPKFQTKFKIDYVYPINDKSKIEAGYNGEYSDANFDYVYQDYDNRTDSWVVSDLNSNVSEYINHIEALYFTYTGEFAGFGYQAGLRSEYNKREFKQKTLNEKYPFEKYSFFPSAYISKTLPLEQELQLTYSRRISRPEDWALNPFPLFSDQYSVMVGNPFLEPEYTNSYELNYQKTFGKSFASLETFYRNTDNSITRLSELGNDGRLVTQFANLNSEITYGAELMGNIMIAKFIMLNPTFSIYQYKVKGSVDDVSKVSQSINSDAMLSLMMFLGRTTKLSIMGFYGSPTVTLQGSMSSHWGINSTIKQDLFKKKLSLSLSVRDIFSTMKFEFTTEGVGYTSANTMNPESPVVMFNLSYKINNYTKRDFKTEDNMNIDL